MVRPMGLLFTSNYSLVSSAASHKVGVCHTGFLHMAGPVQLQCKALRCWIFGLLLRVAALPSDLPNSRHSDGRHPLLKDARVHAQAWVVPRRTERRVIPCTAYL